MTFTVIVTDCVEPYRGDVRLGFYLNLVNVICLRYASYTEKVVYRRVDRIVAIYYDIPDIWHACYTPDIRQYTAIYVIYA